MPRKASPNTSADWRKLQRLIPGYDPYATAAPGQRFDPDAADRVCGFFSCLHHIEGMFAGTPFVLEPWQRAVTGCLFGWKNGDGSRRFREAFVLVPRGNGKTPWAAGICLFCLFCDREPGAQIYSAAADVPQAALLYRHAKNMIAGDDKLESLCTVHDSFRSVTLKSDPASAYRVVSSDAGGKHGQNPHLVICDELHAWQGRELMDAFQSGFAKRGRRQPLLLHLTTADYDRESVCNEKQLYAEKVRDGIIEDSTFLPVLYAAGKDDDWKAESTWQKANPNYGVTVDPRALARECQKAIDMPSYENSFKRFHLNIRTEQANRWLQMDRWDACGGEIDLAALAGRPCYAGLDLSSTTDVTALVLLFPQDGNAVLPFFWIPGEGAEAREHRDRVPYTTWARQGFIEMTDGNRIDYRWVRSRINELSRKYDVRMIGFDPWNAQTFSDQLKDEDGLPIVEFRQGYQSMNEPSKAFEVLVASGDLIHGGNPVLRWMASNVSVRTDPAGNIKPDKERSTERIDGIVALVMAVGCANAYGSQGTSIYEREALLSI